MISIRRPTPHRVGRDARRFLLVSVLGLAACGGLPDGSDRKSQPAEVQQQVGPARISIRYNRPSARGRPLFGGIVPYGEEWDPGADEATQFELTGDFQVEGRTLPAGKYSLWAIPGPDDWTIIFSRAHDVFHTPYPAGKDALRLSVRPRSGPYMETLAFYFPVASEDSTEVDLHWGTTVIPLRFRLR